jgi:hypothetical protein
MYHQSVVAEDDNAYCQSGAADDNAAYPRGGEGKTMLSIAMAARPKNAAYRRGGAVDNDTV